MDAQAASALVEQLKAAGDDIPRLKAAVAAAAVLDGTPGDARQKLRGAT
jgi:hypothetical protein